MSAALDALPLPEPARRALAEVAAGVRGLLGARLERLVLFGSAARGEYVPGQSDLDVLALVRDLGYADAVAASRVGSEASIAHDVLVSVLAVTPEHFEEQLRRERRFALDVEAEGVAP